MMKTYKSNKKSGKLSRLQLIIIGGVALLIIGTVVVLRQTYNHNLQPVSASQRAVLVDIPLGSTVHEIATNLQNQGVIRAAWAFEWYVRNNDVRDQLQAGTYSLRPNQSVQDIVVVLTQGKVATDLVTILPGQRIDQVRSALINNGFSAADVDAALNPRLYANHPALADKPTNASLEGYLYPDSYQKTANTKPQEIIKASLDEMQKHLTPAIREAFVKQHLTVHQGVILASIIEQEISDPADKPVVAQVFLKRLKEGIPLESDVTVIYGALKAGKAPSLTYDSAYNTHLHLGLPPGPISNVTDSSLAAVAHPAHTDYLYFVAGDDGKTYFSRTLEEHQKAVETHCKKLCS